MPRAEVTVIVVVHNAPIERLFHCVASVRASQGVAIRIVVVDNGSAPGALAGGADLLIRRARNDGFAAGVNAALSTVDTPFVLLLNDDALLEPASLRRLVDALDGKPAHVVAAVPKVMLAEEPGIIDSVGIVLRPNGEAFNAGIGQRDKGQFADDADAFGPCFSVALIRSEAFAVDAVGLLDPQYFLYYEDVDWNLRAFLSGRSAITVTGAIAHHLHAATTRTMGEARRYELVQRNLLLCALSNLSWPSVARIWAGRIWIHGEGVVRGPYRRERVRAVGRAVAGAPRAISRRPYRRRAAVRSDHQAFTFSAGLQPYFDAETYRSVALD